MPVQQASDAGHSRTLPMDGARSLQAVLQLEQDGFGTDCVPRGILCNRPFYTDT